MDSKHRKTLEAIFEKLERANIAWRDIEAMFVALGAEISEGNGSRVRVALKDVRAVFHARIRVKKLTKAQSSLFAGFLKRQEKSHDGIQRLYR